MSDFDQILKNVGRGEYDIALELLDNLSDENEIAKQIITANIKLRRRDLEESLSLLNELEEKYPDPKITKEFAEILILKVDVLWLQGNYNRAWAEIPKIVNLIHNVPELTSDLAPVILYLKGRNIAGVKSNEQSLQFYREAAKIFSNSSFRYYEAWNMNRIGVVSDSIPEIDQSLEIFMELEDIQGMANCLLNLTDQHLMRNNHTKANQSFNRLKELDLKDPFVGLQYNLINGMMLKQSDRMRDKAKAQQIFEDILEDDMPDRKAKYLALASLIELNIFEIKASNSKSVLQHTIELVDNFKQIGQDHENPYTICDSLIFQSKLQMIEGDLSKAKLTLQEAKDYAIQNDILGYSGKIDIATNELEAEILRWGSIIQDDVTLTERIIKSKIEDYLPQALRLLKTFEED
ncbi:MAG: tetratricopeptide repeat protein [Candidatus Kariarchaeaceae archaeon]|jgi:tetratricopeptide (TPR) repeat protein